MGNSIRKVLLKNEKRVEISSERRYNSQGPPNGGRNAGIAQSVEHFTRNEGVVSSSLISGFAMERSVIPELKGLRFS